MAEFTYNYVWPHLYLPLYLIKLWKLINTMEKSKLKELKTILEKLNKDLSIHMFRFSMSYEDSGWAAIKREIEEAIEIINKEV